MKVIRKQNVVEEKLTDDHIRCDFCGKLLKVYFTTPHRKEMEKKIRLVASPYYEIFTCHSDWGAESSKSGHTFHACPNCIGKVFHAYEEYASDTKQFECKAELGYIADAKEIGDLKLDENFRPEDPDKFVMQ